jgi:hypothetical protein
MEDEFNSLIAIYKITKQVFDGNVSKMSRKGEFLGD